MRRVHFQENPFKSDVTIVDVKAGTLQEMFESFEPVFGVKHAIFIVGDRIVEDLEYVPLEDEIVYIKIAPKDSASTAGKVFGWIFAGVGLIAMCVPGLQGFGTFMLLGGVAIGGIISIVEKYENRFDDQEKAHNLRGATGTDQPYTPVPVIYGTHYLSPKIVAPEYTVMDTTGKKRGEAEDVYLRQLYVLGQTPVVVDNVAFGDTLAIQRVSTKFRTVTITPNETNTTASVFVDGGDLVSLYRGRISGYKEIKFDGFKHPANNREFKVIGDPAGPFVQISIDQHCVQESADDVEISVLKPTTAFEGAHINAKIITDGNFENSPYPYVVQESYIGTEVKSSSAKPPIFTTPTNTYKADVKIILPGGLYGVNSSGSREAVDLDVRVMYKAEDATQWVRADSITFRGYKTSEAMYGVSEVKFKNWKPDTRYLIEVKKLTTDAKRDAGVNTVQLHSVISYKNTKDGAPLEPASEKAKERYTFLAIEIKAGEHFSGTVNDLSCVIRQGVRTLDTSIGDDNGSFPWKQWVPGYSSNPAAAYLNILTNENLNRYPIGTNGWESPETLPIGWERVKEWFLFCEDHGYFCDGVVSDSTTVREEVSKICVAGRAAPIIIDGLYSVNIDEPKPPVQLFTPRNSWGFTASREYLRDLDGLKMKYVSKDKGYQEAVVVVDKDGSKHRTYEEVMLDYVTDHNHAEKHAHYLYNSLQYRQEIFTFSADFEQLICTVGDRIKLQHDVPLVGQASARVVGHINTGTQDFGLKLDEYVTFDDDADYGIVVRAIVDGLVELKTMDVYPRNSDKVDGQNYINTNVVMIRNPENAPVIDVGDLVAFGTVGQETIDLSIVSIQSGEDLTAEITCVPYNERLFQFDTLEVHHPLISEPPSIGRKASFPTREQQQITKIHEEINVLNYPKTFVDVTPTPPYSIGDWWKRGINTYVAKRSRSVHELFRPTDWKLATSETHQAISSETFGDPQIEDRWYIKGNSFPILWTHEYVTRDGDISVSNILSDDDHAWKSNEGRLLIDSKLTPEEVHAVIGKGQEVALWGRHGNNSWLGEGYENIYASSVIVEDGETYVLQTYTGEIETSFGTAYPQEPLVFVGDGSTVTFNETDVMYPMLTKTEFVPPYAEGVGNEIVYTSEIETIDIEGAFRLPYPDEVLRTVFSFYKDDGNYVWLQFIDRELVITYVSGGELETREIPFNDMEISLVVKQDENLIVMLNDEEYVFDDLDLIDSFETMFVGSTHEGEDYFNGQVLELSVDVGNVEDPGNH